MASKEKHLVVQIQRRRTGVAAAGGGGVAESKRQGEEEDDDNASKVREEDGEEDDEDLFGHAMHALDAVLEEFRGDIVAPRPGTEDGSLTMEGSLESTSLLTEPGAGGSEADGGREAAPSLPSSRRTGAGLRDIGAKSGSVMSTRALAAHRRGVKLVFAGLDFSDSECAALVRKVAQVPERVRALVFTENDAAMETAEVLAENLEPMINLAELDLCSTKLNVDSIQVLSKALAVSSNTFSAVRVLGLRSCALTDDGGAALFTHLLGNAIVEVINLTSTAIADRTAQALTRCLAHERCVIEDLSLCNNNITSAGVRPLAAVLGSQRTLKVLQLGGNMGVGDRGFCALCTALRDNETLTELNMANCGIGDKGAIDLASMLEDNVHLNTLSLACNQIQDDGIFALSRNLQGNFGLRNLDMSNNRFGGTGSVGLGFALSENRCLQYFTLSGNRLSLQAINAVASGMQDNIAMQILDITRCRLTDECVENLKDALRNNQTLDQLFLHGNFLSQENEDELGKLLRERPRRSPADTLREVEEWRNAKMEAWREVRFANQLLKAYRAEHEVLEKDQLTSPTNKGRKDADYDSDNNAEEEEGAQKRRKGRRRSSGTGADVAAAGGDGGSDGGADVAVSSSPGRAGEDCGATLREKRRRRRRKQKRQAEAAVAAAVAEEEDGKSSEPMASSCVRGEDDDASSQGTGRVDGQGSKEYFPPATPHGVGGDEDSTTVAPQLFDAALNTKMTDAAVPADADEVELARRLFRVPVSVGRAVNVIGYLEVEKYTTLEVVRRNLVQFDLKESHYGFTMARSKLIPAHEEARRTVMYDCGGAINLRPTNWIDLPGEEEAAKRDAEHRASQNIEVI